MKILKSNRSMIAIFMGSLMLIVSCSQYEPMANQAEQVNPNYQPNSNSVGTIHNEILQKIEYDVMSRSYDHQFNEVRDVYNYGRDFILSEYPELYDEYEDMEVRRQFYRFEEDLSEYDVLEHLEHTGRGLVDAGDLPQWLFDFVERMIVEYWPHYTFVRELSMAKMIHRDEIMANPDLQNMIAIFEDIAYHSNNYWLGDRGIGIMADRCDWGGYIADAAVGLLLSWTVFGAIVGGFVASYIAEEDCRS